MAFRVLLVGLPTPALCVCVCVFALLSLAWFLRAFSDDTGLRHPNVKIHRGLFTSLLLFTFAGVP